MIDTEQFNLLKQGADSWNGWRQANPTVEPNLNECDLSNADLRNVNLSRANLSAA